MNNTIQAHAREQQRTSLVRRSAFSVSVWQTCWVFKIHNTPVMACNELGRLVEDDWARIPKYFSDMRLGAYQVI